MTTLQRWGALVGLLAGSGLLLVTLAIVQRRQRSLYLRMSPWLSHRGLSADQRAHRVRTRYGAHRGWFWERLVRLLQIMTGADVTVVRRLRAAGVAHDPEAVRRFRMRQVVLAGAASVLAVLFIGLIAGGTAVRPGVAGMVVAIAAVAGILLADQGLTRRARRGRERMTAELPVLTELLSMAITAGESPALALARVGRTSRGPLAREFGAAADQVRGGDSLVPALRSMADGLALPSLGRLVDAVAVAGDRGAPIRDVLRAQAADLRSQTSRALLESAGRKEIAMLIPVVFLVMPMVVLVVAGQ